MKTAKFPHHLGIIMDGNRRWAKKNGLPALEGHKRGLENLKKITGHCRKQGIKILTVFAFSTENWNRSKKEVNYLIKLFLRALGPRNFKELSKDKTKINILGKTEKFPKNLKERIQKIQKITCGNKDFILNIALSYGGRLEMVEAVKKIMRKKILPRKINEDLISENLWTKNMPDPDLIIRTGNEKRISNFLIWQGAYSELYFSKKYWPEFSEKELDRAFLDYARRQRRFGK